ncbi:hypothetical protein M6B38_332590 [Iris pallida]|uniref:Uncharacterized protein n=1 Tax=Iris pallida TaxID=29817 RepID=A0AAX6H2L9_IRIPA|nr:hypothetical protein M6B38_332590 [Iris pallida]
MEIFSMEKKLRKPMGLYLCWKGVNMKLYGHVKKTTTLVNRGPSLVWSVSCVHYVSDMVRHGTVLIFRVSVLPGFEWLKIGLIHVASVGYVWPLKPLTFL